MGKERFALIDVEASGLMAGSYPIEVGWALLNGTSDSLVIRPEPDWTSECWDPVAEHVHGMARETVVSTGRDLVTVTSTLNRELGGKFVLSDAPEHDARWIDMIFERAGEQRRFSVVSIERLLGHLGFKGEGTYPFFEAAARIRPPAGRAVDGALHLLEVIKAAVAARGGHSL